MSNKELQTSLSHTDGRRAQRSHFKLLGLRSGFRCLCSVVLTADRSWRANVLYSWATSQRGEEGRSERGRVSFEYQNSQRVVQNLLHTDTHTHLALLLASACLRIVSSEVNWLLEANKQSMNNASKHKCYAVKLTVDVYSVKQPPLLLKIHLMWLRRKTLTDVLFAFRSLTSLSQKARAHETHRHLE